jgi:predicted metalloprotease with PDZ domain
MTVNRNQKEIVIKIVAILRDAKSENMGTNGEAPTIKELGLALKEVDGAIEVQSVEELSEASQKGLKPGMKILSINRIAVTKIEEVNKIIKEFNGDNIMLKLSYQNKEFIEFLRIR